MSKRLSSGQTTLLDFFSSPKAKLTKSKETEPQKENSKPANTNDSDEEITKKRKRTAIISSDSDNENSPVKAAPQKSTNKTLLDTSSSTDDEDEPKNKKNVKLPAKKRKLKQIRKPDDGDDDDEKEEAAAEKTLKRFAFEKTTNGSSRTDQSERLPDTKPVAPVATGDVHTNWLHNRLEFLQPHKICDINKNRPGHPDYDSRTLFIPKGFLDKQTPAMRQWWLLKSTHMDSVLFFKVGKFYELYHMDAVVGVTQLAFSYMKGEFAHSGFPESAYHKMANALISKGFKVARTEQTETPEMMADRCKKQGKSTKFDKVVNREICQISTKATCVYTAQLPDASSAFPCYMFAITEKDLLAPTINFGVCFIDTSIGVFNMGEFEDDKHCSRLLAMFAAYPPGLILTERCRISPKLKKVLNTYFKDVRRDSLASEKQFYSASSTIEKLLNRDYFRDKKGQLCTPEFIKNRIEGYSPKAGCELMFKCLGACLWYLEDSKLDIQIVSMGKCEQYQPLNLCKKLAAPPKNFMIMDSTTIKNLTLLGSQDSLQKAIDYCNTPFGKRMLIQWICRPLCDIEKIQERQQAIKELKENTALIKDTQDLLKTLPDLERQVAKIHIYGNKYFAKNHPDSRAVFYEAATYSKRRINDLLTTLQVFENVQPINMLFKDCTSSLLRKITKFEPDGMFINLSESLEFFKKAFDQKKAKEDGKIIPKEGIDDDYDNCQRAIQEIKNKLDQYLIEQQTFFGCKVTYFGSDKKRFQLDIPEKYAHKATNEYQLEGAKKGSKPTKRYSTPQSRQLLADMIKAESEMAKIIQDLNRCIFEKFSERQSQWEQVINCLTILDVLCSLAEYARNYAYDICIPVVKPFTESNEIIIKDGRHPCLPGVDNFVPNDTTMGRDDLANILLITGPNMGGKSTLMRQIAIITVMAQIGGYVPASYCELNLIDRIFTRLGAHDDIIQGQSTFLVELDEASCILQHATQYSLVLLDELGRGTSTHDGNAIATAYVRKLTEIHCRTLFSTHYHSLVDNFIGRNDIQLGHMACMVVNDEDPSNESVVFLYKMTPGRCPKSYGFSVARLAGLNGSIVGRGQNVAKELEQQSKNRELLNKVLSADVDAVRKLISSLDI